MSNPFDEIREAREKKEQEERQRHQLEEKRRLESQRRIEQAREEEQERREQRERESTALREQYGLMIWRVLDEFGSAVWGKGFLRKRYVIRTSLPYAFSREYLGVYPTMQFATDRMWAIWERAEKDRRCFVVVADTDSFTVGIVNKESTYEYMKLGSGIPGRPVTCSRLKDVDVFLKPSRAITASEDNLREALKQMVMAPA